MPLSPFIGSSQPGLSFGVPKEVFRANTEPPSLAAPLDCSTGRTGRHARGPSLDGYSARSREQEPLDWLQTPGPGAYKPQPPRAHVPLLNLSAVTPRSDRPPSNEVGDSVMLLSIWPSVASSPCRLTTSFVYLPSLPRMCLDRVDIRCRLG